MKDRKKESVSISELSRFIGNVTYSVDTSIKSSKMEYGY